MRKVTFLRCDPRGQDPGSAHLDLFLQPPNLPQCLGSSREAAVMTNLSSDIWTESPSCSGNPDVQSSWLGRGVCVCVVTVPGT